MSIKKEEEKRRVAKRLREISRVSSWAWNSPTMSNEIDKVADLLDPPQYPHNGEIVEFRTEDGKKGIGYAGDSGVRILEYYIIKWEEIEDYRIIREQYRIIPHPNEWPDDVDMIEVGIRSVWQSGKSGWRSTNFFIILKLAEEIWRGI